MAINKTIFTADRTAQKGEIFNWLKANAEDYFDEITQNADGNIVCSLESGAELQFIFYTTVTTYTVKTKTGNTHTVYGGNSPASYTKAGIVTSNGIMLIGNTSTSSIENYVIISKTKANSTALAMCIKTSSANTSYSYFIDLNNDAEWLGRSVAAQAYSVPVTSVAPAAFSSGNYCEHVFFTPFTQFTEPCIMQLNGKKYAYGGYLALEE